MELTLKYPSSMMREMKDMRDTSGMASRSDQISMSWLLRPIDLPPQPLAPALELFGRSRR